VTSLQRQADIFFHVWRKLANIHGRLKMLAEMYPLLLYI